MIPVESWKILYGDGSVFTSNDGTWAEAPPFGVYAIVYYNIDGTTVVQQEQCDDSRYEWPEDLAKPDGWIVVEGAEAAGTMVKYGLWVDNDTYYALFDAARGEVIY